MNVTEEVLRFAELAARTGLEPGLARRLGGEPGALLVKFGPVAGRAVRAGGDVLRVESLSTADTADAKWCICTSDLLDARVGA